MKRLEGKTALITGATSGIGETIAKLFAMEGAAVLIVGRNEAKGNEVVKQICNDGGTAAFCYCDVTKKESVKKLRAEFENKYTLLESLDSFDLSE